MTECRQLTLGLFTHLEDNLFRQQAHPDFSPAGWHLGHIAFIEAQWILEYFAGQAPIFSEYHQLFAADGLPKDQRQNLPSFEAIADYLTMVREKVFTYLKTAPIQQQERLWWWLLQHETQHNETISFVLALHKLRRGQPVFQTDQASTTPVKTTMVTVPAGEFRCGSDAIFAQDNERSPHTIYLDDYHIDTYPVTCSDFQTFIDSGGYNSAELWSPAGWAWQTQAKITKPLYWTGDEKFCNHPVCGVSYYEAEAYAKFVGKRLPTEFEWEKAAAWQPEQHRSQLYPWGNRWQMAQCNHSLRWTGTTPVKAFSKNKSFYGCHDCLGNVWEWTSSTFQPYPDFVAYPYRGYSAVYFDDTHYVLRGGSWVTRRWGVRNGFRNWYNPWTREIFAGFRCAS